MPYLITTYTTEEREPELLPLEDTRTAVATLDEARKEATAECIAAEGAAARPDTWDERFAQFERACQSLPEDGGTIGPLPDGTVIEVQPVTYQWLTDALAGDYAANATLPDDAVLAAFNGGA